MSIVPKRDDNHSNNNERTQGVADVSGSAPTGGFPRRRGIRLFSKRNVVLFSFIS